MTALADLARSLGGIELSTAAETAPSYHTLLLTYPVFELLPVGVSQPHLEPPALLKQRQPPPSDPELAAIHDTTFFTRLPVQPRNPFALTPVKDSHAGLLAAIDAASTMPGTTKMDAVTFADPNTGEMIHRFRLCTKLQGAATPPQDFELANQEWCELLKHQYRTSWIRLLNHIVQRMSVRAYYHIRGQLIEAYGETVANSEEAAWAGLWNAHPSRSIRRLLIARLCPEHTGSHWDMLEDGNGSLLITPPCGHQTILRKISLVALTAEACQTYGCPSCGARVLQPEDDSELCLRNVSLRAEAFVENYSAWTDLDETSTVEEQQVQLPALAIFCAIPGALASLKLPALISPPELSFIGLRETQLLFAELEEKFGEGQWTFIGTSKELFDGLISLARTALARLMDSATPSEDALPPNWSQNVERWFNRAVQLLFDRGCRATDSEHAGLHLHDGDIHCGVLDMDQYENAMADGGSEEHSQKVTSMDELAKLLTGSKLKE